MITGASDVDMQLCEDIGLSHDTRNGVRVGVGCARNVAFVGVAQL